MAVVHLPTKFGEKKSISKPELLTFFRNPRWRPPPSWIFNISKLGTFRHLNGVVLDLCTKFGSNISYSH